MIHKYSLGFYYCLTVNSYEKSISLEALSEIPVKMTIYEIHMNFYMKFTWISSENSLEIQISKFHFLDLNEHIFILTVQRGSICIRSRKSAKWSSKIFDSEVEKSE